MARSRCHEIRRAVARPTRRAPAGCCSPRSWARPPGPRGELDLFGRRIPVGIAVSATWASGRSTDERDPHPLAAQAAGAGLPRGSRTPRSAGSSGCKSGQVSSRPTAPGTCTAPMWTTPSSIRSSRRSATASRDIGAGGAGSPPARWSPRPLSETSPYTDGAQYNASRWNRPVPAALVGLSWAL